MATDNKNTPPAPDPEKDDAKQDPLKKMDLPKKVKPGKKRGQSLQEWRADAKGRGNKIVMTGKTIFETAIKK